MKVRQLSVRNFRGIRELDWTVSGSRVCLVGPGDSTKTTILDAIEYVLSPRWRLRIDDSDFYNADISIPISISATFVDFPEELRRDSKFGLHTRGWSSGGQLNDEFEDDDELALTVRLTVDESLEPVWEVFTERGSEHPRFGSGDRRKLGVLRFDAFTDRHLSWADGSVLSRITGEMDDLSNVLANASRAARKTLTSTDLPLLEDGAKNAMKIAAKFGAGVGGEYRPHLDAKALSLGSGVFSLHDGDIPLRRSGTGSRQLITLAIQNELGKRGGVALIDEIEHGLEPHRLRHLLKMLRPLEEDERSENKPHGQVFMTTHSPIAIQELQANEVMVVRSCDGITRVCTVDDLLQPVIRRVPEALLGRKLLVCEGKTEMGFASALDSSWSNSEDSFANMGVVIVYGTGSQAPNTAVELASLGYDVALLGDSDVELDPDVESMEKKGVSVILWDGDVAIEQRLFIDLPWPSVLAMVAHAVKTRSEESVLGAVAGQMKMKPADLGAAQGWSDTDELRRALGLAAKSKKSPWFKRFDYGQFLGEVTLGVVDKIPGKDVAKKISEIRRWAFGE